jgi:hypothetical protein
MNPYFKELGLTPTAALARRAEFQAKAERLREIAKAQRESVGQPSTKTAFVEAAKARRASLSGVKTNPFTGKERAASTAPLNWPKK